MASKESEVTHDDGVRTRYNTAPYPVVGSDVEVVEGRDPSTDGRDLAMEPRRADSTSEWLAIGEEVFDEAPPYATSDVATVNSDLVADVERGVSPVQDCEEKALSIKGQLTMQGWDDLALGPIQERELTRAVRDLLDGLAIGEESSVASIEIRSRSRELYLLVADKDEVYGFRGSVGYGPAARALICTDQATKS